ncbi:hypothetical protein Mapa_015869 [Marchantia paleacea]|nr:hypothetical protein Mapa_015869 [Marchantia paleacea]
MIALGHKEGKTMNPMASKLLDSGRQVLEIFKWSTLIEIRVAGNVDIKLNLKTNGNVKDERTTIGSVSVLSASWSSVPVSGTAQR